jgi:hypothetical protein
VEIFVSGDEDDLYYARHRRSHLGFTQGQCYPRNLVKRFSSPSNASIWQVEPMFMERIGR